MSRKRYDFEEHCVDSDGNDVIIIQESDSPATEITDENLAYKYIYTTNSQSNGNNGTTRYQFLESAPPNDNEHHRSLGSTSFNATGSVQRPTMRPTLGSTDWKEEEIKLMLKRFKEYSPNVGRDKSFKNKKDMWLAIAKEMNDKFDVGRSSAQCMSKFFHRFQKFKTPKKPGDLNFQDELDSIDSIHEIIMDDLDSAKLNELELHARELSNPEAILGHILPKTLIELAKINAHAQERRHREYMDFVRGFEARFMDKIDKL